MLFYDYKLYYVRLKYDLKAIEVKTAHVRSFKVELYRPSGQKICSLGLIKLPSSQTRLESDKLY